VVFSGDACGMPGRADQEKADFDFAAMEKMGYDAVALGELEFVHGRQFLESQLKRYPYFVCSNVVWSETGKPLAPPLVYRTYRLKAAPARPAAQLTVAVFSLLSQDFATNISPFMSSPADRVSVLDPIAEARKMVAAAGKKAQLVVALAHMTEGEAKEMVLQVPGIDVVILGHGLIRQIIAPEKVKSTLVVAESNEGKYVGQLVLALNSRGGVEAYAGTSIRMDEKIADDPAMAKMLAQAKEGWVKPPGASGATLGAK
jgi:2',3'-cyclic-nucleotide 2'-phosphodiesterase (5'-nucleotidase family)